MPKISAKELVLIFLLLLIAGSVGYITGYYLIALIGATVGYLLGRLF